LHLWDIALHKEIRSFKTSQAGCSSVAFSADGGTIAALGDRLYLWDADTGKPLHDSTQQDRLYSFVNGNELAFSPDSLLVAEIGYDGEANYVALVEVGTGRRIATHKNAEIAPRMACVVFSPDGQFLAVGNDEKNRLLDTISGRIVRTFVGHVDKVTCLAFSADGKILVSSSEDCTAVAWDTSNLASELKQPALKPDQLPSLWDEFRGNDCLKAYAAFLQMRGAPDQSLPSLKKQLRPVTPVEAKHLDRLIADLDSDNFQNRDKATRELGEIGDLAQAALRKALKDDTSLEASKRIKELLDALDSPTHARRVSWSVKLLECMHTPESRKLIEELTRGVPESRQTREAKAALERLAARTPP
jgi:hypothetical protein